MPFIGNDWLGDIRIALRTLAKNPAFSAVAVTMLAVGIGVNAAVFTVTNAVLFKGFPRIANSDRIAYVSNDGCCLSYPDFEDYRAQAQSFDGMAITHGISGVLSDGKGFSERLSVTEVSAGAFRLTGQHPVIGRDFASSDESAGAPAVALLSYDFWRSRYAGDPAIAGREVHINGAPTTYIGVMPEGFSFPQKQDLWVPLVKTARVLDRGNHDTWMAFGPLKPGVTLESARAEILTIAKRLAIAYPSTNQEIRVTVQNFHQFMIGNNAATLYGSMWGAVGFVLLIACANLANLLLARALARSREISVRIALGAGRWRIMRQLLIESVLLSGLGGALGWWLAKLGVRAYALAVSHKSAWLIVDYTMDHRVLAYLIAISIGTGVLFGLAPALQLSKVDINAILKSGGRGAIGGERSKHLASILVAGEMALAVVLMAGAGVMIRSFIKVQTADIGIATDHVLVGEVALPASYAGAESQVSFFDRLKTRLGAVSGVESVAISSELPSWNTARRTYATADSGDVVSDDRGRLPKIGAMAISPDYFQTVQAHVLAGRDFDNHDNAAAPLVVMVNERLASTLWPGQDAMGKRLRSFDGKTQGPWLTVVGVVSNIVQNDRTRQKFSPVIYSPYAQSPASTMWVMARTAIPPGNLSTAFRREVQALDADLPVYGPFPLGQGSDVFSDDAFYGTLFLIFAVIALLLASAGLYSLMAHSVSRRTQEIGIRMAIGATTRDIRKFVLIQGMFPLAIGLAVGLAGSFLVNQILKSQLIGITPSDPPTLILTSGVLIFAALLGCLIPARRATRVDPLVALRHE
jgi:predicted permease